MDIAIFRRRQYLSFGAVLSRVAASALRRLTATYGLVLLAQIRTRTTWFTIVAMSTQPTAITVSSDCQSAVSTDNFRGWRSVLWRGDPEPGKARKSGAHPWRRAERTRPETEHERQLPEDISAS